MWAVSGLCSVGPCVLTSGGVVGSWAFEYSQSPREELGLLSLVFRDTSSDPDPTSLWCVLVPILSLFLGDGWLERVGVSSCPSHPCGRSSLPVSDFRVHGSPGLFNCFPCLVLSLLAESLKDKKVLPCQLQSFRVTGVNSVGCECPAEPCPGWPIATWTLTVPWRPQPVWTPLLAPFLPSPEWSWPDRTRELIS